MSTGPQLFRIDPETHKSESIEEVDFARLGFRERQDIQEWVAANPDILGENLLVIGKEFSGFDRTSERLDLLAVDTDGKLVVIELKRDDTGADVHWQAIKYASYLRGAKSDKIVSMLARYTDEPEEKAQENLLRHLDSDDLEFLNNDQRIILASHRFAPEVTSAALWLNEKTGEDLITCVQLTPYQDAASDSLYIQANMIIPVPGVEAYTIGIGESQDVSVTATRTPLWQTFQRHKNDHITPFLRTVGELTVDSLSGEIKPDKKSKWAGREGDGRRYYHMWYKRPPWRNWGMSYSIDLKASPDTWEATVGLTYWGSGIEDLKDTLETLHIHDDQKFEGWGAFIVSRSSNALDDAFAKTLADTLRPFIEVITPKVHEAFDNEHNEEDN